MPIIRRRNGYTRRRIRLAPSVYFPSSARYSSDRGKLPLLHGDNCIGLSHVPFNISPANQITFFRSLIFYNLKRMDLMNTRIRKKMTTWA